MSLKHPFLPPPQVLNKKMGRLNNGVSRVPRPACRVAREFSHMEKDRYLDEIPPL